MPLWNIHHPAGVYSDQDKQDFAADITRIYARAGLPEFYVVVLFHEITSSNFLIGGKPTADTVRIDVAHIARHLDDPQQRVRLSERLNAAMLPYTRDRGLHWEFHVDETPRDLWMIEGMVPPPTGSEAEKAWVAANSPLPY